MICLTLDLNSPDNFDIETIKISFRRLRQSYANDRRLVYSIPGNLLRKTENIIFDMYANVLHAIE